MPNRGTAVGIPVQNGNLMCGLCSVKSIKHPFPAFASRVPLLSAHLLKPSPYGRQHLPVSDDRKTASITFTLPMESSRELAVPRTRSNLKTLSVRQCPVCPSSAREPLNHGGKRVRAHYCGKPMLRSSSAQRGARRCVARCGDAPFGSRTPDRVSSQRKSKSLSP